jgi:hypothetical protein
MRSPERKDNSYGARELKSASDQIEPAAYGGDEVAPANGSSIAIGPNRILNLRSGGLIRDYVDLSKAALERRSIRLVSSNAKTVIWRRIALPTTSAGRFWRLGPVGMPVSG